jgi:hypothetical protein
MKKVNLDLTTVDGNAFFLMGAFSNQAKRQGWTKEEIDSVMKEAMSSNYNHLVATLQLHCK